jgi:hypothetical protein
MAMYRLQRIEVKPIYDVARDQTVYKEQIVDTLELAYEDIPQASKQLKVSPERLQATLENRAPQIEKEGIVYRPYPYTYRTPRAQEPIESPQFVASIEAKNERIRAAQRAGLVEKPSTLENWEYLGNR